MRFVIEPSGERAIRRGNLISNTAKCLEVRQKPVSEQSGSTQCTLCSRWFQGRGDQAEVKQCTAAGQQHDDMWSVVACCLAPLGGGGGVLYSS